MLRPFSLVVCLFLPAITLAGDTTPKGIEFFEKKIRPVLVTHCYECHSTQSKKLKAQLLLDSKEGMRQGGVSGELFTLGKAKDSLLIKALRHDGDTKMPKKPLPKEIVADFVQWINMGAPDPRVGKAPAVKRMIDIETGRKFWSFQPLAKVTPPPVKNESWVRTPLDRFILAKLEEKGMKPASPLSKERLLRRATFDATGLPPTPDEIDAFVNDTSPDAYAKVVDRLLQSERHGERWARHWLDTVRYAESGGYEFDKDRPSAHHYRDFVIKALNSDMPFDQFVKLQLAGDLLQPEDLQAMAATGFLVAGPYPGQTTAKTLQLIRYDHLDDMVSTIGSSMLGLSLGCVRCHEHKYDPIPQEDYYRLLANLSRTDSVDAKVNTEPENYRKLKAAFDQAHVPFVKARDQYEQGELPKTLQSFWNEKKDAKAPTWLILDRIDAKGPRALTANPDGSLSAAGKAKKNETFTITTHTMQKQIKALRLEALTDKTTGADGVFVLTEISVVAAPLNPAMKAKIKPTPVKLRAGQATSQDAKFPLAGAIDADKKTGWSAGPASDKDHAAIFEFEGNIGFDAGTALTVTLKFEGEHFAIARPRLAITTATPAAIDAKAEMQTMTELLTALTPTKGQWKAEQRAAIIPWLRKLDAQTDKVYRAVEDHAKLEPQPQLVNVWAATNNRGGDVHFLIRGEVEKKREVAKAGFIRVLMTSTEPDKKWLEPKEKTAPRIALANWMTDTENGAGHLLARVIVNRLWQHHMGKGIVGTPNDFGAQGDAPTHPELLDYLAHELINNGWRLRPIHKLIMTSAVYAQSGAIDAEQHKLDPQNRLWWRRPARRIEAEAVRDNLLAVAGTLDPKQFGPGTLDVNSQRRSVYLTVKRSQMIPFLQMFDIPEGMQSIGERSVTTVPTQSLAFMNSPLVRGAAQKLAARVRPKTPELTPTAIDQAYRIALGRMPSDHERQRMLSFVDRQAESYGKAPQARDTALADFCQVLICLNEFIYVD
jgi:hypothetical protein